jgi:hypothetical protein
MSIFSFLSLPIFFVSFHSTMPPFVSSSSFSVPVLEPIRLCLVPLACFYCGNSEEEELCEWRIHYLFGLFHCKEHTSVAERDCKNFMKHHGIVRMYDAIHHPILGPFLTALGSNIPVLRTSGEVQQGWCFPALDEVPSIRKSKTTQEWLFHLTNGVTNKFVPLCQFQDARVSPFLSPETLLQVDAVIACLETGVYE